jgi:hypothetical protein
MNDLDTFIDRKRLRRVRWLGGPNGDLQKCSECENVTRYWHMETDKPLCKVCSLQEQESDDAGFLTPVKEGEV